MKSPLRIVPNGLGELADVKDADDRYVAHCAEPDDARTLANLANGRDSLAGALSEATEKLADMRKFLRSYRNTTEWHGERKRRMAEPGTP